MRRLLSHRNATGFCKRTSKKDSTECKNGQLKPILKGLQLQAPQLLFYQERLIASDESLQ
jgi:hypothetical protein